MPRSHAIAPDRNDPLSGYPDNLIINRPDLKSKPLILGEQLLTIIFWGFWFYLWLPLISVIAWLLGFRILYTHLMELGGVDNFFAQFDTFSRGVALASGLLACWSFYNLKRYGSYNRRTAVLKTDVARLKKDFSLSDRDWRTLQEARILRLSFDTRGGIVQVVDATREAAAIKRA
ncbi:MAG TPA: poly-beta-1,6-N-acetyl-D-glucosamine biosynthesis protein PgaD [Desulfobulbus sp.]|nr:poly-beta-1,6-N-acetyl-D-glucosamine biosynthesis protein PgaD [Desulfobulbus sp.]